MKIKKLFRFYKATYLNLLFFIFSVSGFTLPSAFGQPHPYKFNFLTVDEGLSHTDANDVSQDKKGYIWVATYFGLDRYDGYAIKKYYNSNVPVNNAFKNRIICIYPDADGNIWLGTEDGIQCFNTATERYIDYKSSQINNKIIPGKIYKPKGNLIFGLVNNVVQAYTISGTTLTPKPLNLPTSMAFGDMVCDKAGELYLASTRGLWKLEGNTVVSVPVAGLDDQHITHITFDARGNLLATIDNSVLLIPNAPGSRTLADNSHLTVSKRYVYTAGKRLKNVVTDNHFYCWVNAGSSLIRLDSNLNFVQEVSNRSAQASLNSNTIARVFIDRTQCLWVCTFGGGLNYCDLNEKLFYTLRNNPAVPNSLSGNHIRSILEDGDNLWIGTTANGLNLYNLKTENFSHYNTYNSAIRLRHDAVSALTFDNAHNLWIGSSTGIDILSADRTTLLHPSGSEQFPGNSIETLVKDYYGNIWFGNHTSKAGVIWKDAGQQYHVKYYGESYFIYADKNKPQLLMSSTHGLRRVAIDAQGNITKTITYHANAGPNSLSSDYTYPISKQSDRLYWVGTIGGGLNSLSLNPGNDGYTIKTYNGNYGVFNDVESTEIDNAGNIWMGGNGLECFNPITGKLIRYDKNDGLQGNSFKVGSSYRGAGGRLYFGGINGLNYFYPDQIRANPIPAQPMVTDMIINNRRVRLGAPDSTENNIEEAVGYGQDIKLDYRQNNFVIFFSAMHFANPLKCRYRYKLIGFDKDWKYTAEHPPGAAYSNLDYKNYQFVVEATNNDGVWSRSQAAINIIITPPWWKSGLAKVIYALLFIFALSAIYWLQARWYRLKREMEVNAVNEKKREELHKHREELYQQQLMFFTNVSHEFRTPLTLILGPLENLISQNKNTALDYSYQLMFRNAKRLINLIGELMNFKKVSDSIVKLQVQPLQIKQFCSDLTWEFQNLALSKGITFEMTDHTNTVDPAQLTAPFDVQVLEKILFNLLNNSFKYTNAGGQVSFEVFFDLDEFKPSFETGFQLLNEGHRAKKYIYFRVADTGIGISNDSITFIFDRYYRISKNHLGSGVGLALVKSLTQLHKGDIYVYSERYKGTEIIIGIPWGEENYQPAEKATAGAEAGAQLEAIDQAILKPLPQRDQDENDGHATPHTRKHILLVDDNHELLTFLKHAFETTYTIYEAEDAPSAIRIATEKVPDLIISDVMMPGITGIELCKIIKDQFETRHIPFIILSAKDALDTKIEGMESGADFYFSKPLSIDLLTLTISNIFEQSEKLRQRHTNNYLSDVTDLVHSEKDKEFFKKITSLIEDNIKDPDMDVDFLCHNLYISRTKLYQKIKSITNQSVSEFIRTVRLKKAVQIMTHEDIAMNEIVDRIGFQSSSNFSRAFKKEYGKSPLHYLQSLKKTDKKESIHH